MFLAPPASGNCPSICLETYNQELIAASHSFSKTAIQYFPSDNRLIRIDLKRGALEGPLDPKETSRGLILVN